MGSLSLTSCLVGNKELRIPFSKGKALKGVYGLNVHTVVLAWLSKYYRGCCRFAGCL